jgi:uncharacterized membrane protein
MAVADPAALVLALGLLAGLLGAALVRRGRNGPGAFAGAALGAMLAGASSPWPPGPQALAAGAVGAATSLLLPGLGLARFRRRTFGAAFERLHGGGRGEALLPARIARLRPSGLLDPADRLRLESAIHGAEEKSAAAIAVAFVQRCAAYEGAGWRAAAWLGALLAAWAVALVPAPRAALAAGAGGVALGHLLARTPRARRFFVAESELAAGASQAAALAFASAGLGGTGVLVFAALFEGRVLALGGERNAGAGWDEVAAIAAGGIRARRALDGLVSALQCAARLAPPRDTAAPAPGSRPHPVRVED